jgi:membrane-bound serine protease (ClpP class)
MKGWRPFLAAGLLFGPAWSLIAGTVSVIRIQGPIGPATSGYISRALQQAAAQSSECLIIQLDTLGGLLGTTEEIVKQFYSAPVPTVVYVAPAGATATSAGCFITLASDIAAMTPNTSIGAAHPVVSGGGGAEKLDDVMKQKMENAAASYIEGIAVKRGRNAEWARESVRNSASITAEKALELNVVEIIAKDMPDLLRQLDGRKVKERVLQTAAATVVEIPMSTREKVFQVFWHPEVLMILMLIATFGIMGELSNPGAIFPGVIGAVALILALYLGAVLPVNIAGVALMILAVALFIIDVFAPTHGVLTVGGIVAFFLGALMLFDEPAFRLSWKFVLPATLLTAAFFAFVVGAGLRAQFLPVKAGIQTMLGKTAPALTRIDTQSGKLFVEGEYWDALSDVPIEPGQPVEIVRIDGLTLKVKPKPQET